MFDAILKEYRQIFLYSYSLLGTDRLDVIKQLIVFNQMYIKTKVSGDYNLILFTPEVLNKIVNFQSVLYEVGFSFLISYTQFMQKIEKKHRVH